MTFDPVAYINTPRWQESRLGLERTRDLMERLGRPQDKLRFVHVAGTNGKGSTCAYLASVLQEAGYRVGLFTSPYIETFEERIRVNGVNISMPDLTAATLAVKECADAMEAETGDHPTEFELMTAVALVHFAQAGCDIVVLEVGLGGRLDSTNIIDAPEACVIARIGLDHTAVLGNTVAEVAGEKAGIVKPGSPVVSWPQEPEAMAVVERVAAECGCELHVPDFSALEVAGCEMIAPASEAVASKAICAAPDASILLACPAPDSPSAPRSCGTRASRSDSPRSREALPANLLRESSSNASSGAAVLVREFSYRGVPYVTQLLGSYQPYNAVLALEVVEALRQRGWNIPGEAVSAGIARTVWPARFEVVAQQPLTIVDGGHNPQGAQVLAESLRDVLPGVKPVFIISVLADKDYPEMLAEVLPLAQACVAATPPNPRALSAAELAEAIREIAPDVPVYETDGFPQAVEKARELAGADDVIVAFGSLYSVGDLKAAMRARL